MTGDRAKSTTSGQVDVERDADLLVLRLALGRGNVLDLAALRALRAALAEHARDPAVKTILFTARGADFSFGASIPEHLPAARGGAIERYLPEFHGLFRDLMASRRVLLAAVRGRCLGGGLELAAFAQRVFAAPDAKLGCPEIRLGVFAPVGAIVLPHRCGARRGEELLLTGSTLDAEAARAAGLIDAIATDPEAAARTWHASELRPLSAAALRHTVRAVRHDLHRRLDDAMSRLEAQYLGELMRTEDAAEGLDAFLAKRVPRWNDR